MKYKYTLGLLALFTPLVLVQAETEVGMEDNCPQMEQSAISPTGRCQTFWSPCDVPQDWRFIPSCDLLEDPDFGLSPEELDRRRQANRWEILKEQKQQKEEEKLSTQHSYQKIGGGTITRDNMDILTGKGTIKREETDRKLRTMSSRKYHSQKYNHAVDYRRDPQPTSSERKARRRTSTTRQRYGISHVVKNKNLDKPLSRKPSWFTQRHYKENYGSFSNRWKSYTDLIKEESRIRKNSTRMGSTGAQLRRTYVGERRTGDMSEALLDN